jgi:hypothetical protein
MPNRCAGHNYGATYPAGWVHAETPGTEGHKNAAFKSWQAFPFSAFMQLQSKKKEMTEDKI